MHPHDPSSVGTSSRPCGWRWSHRTFGAAIVAAALVAGCVRVDTSGDDDEEPVEQAEVETPDDADPDSSADQDAPDEAEDEAETGGGVPRIGEVTPDDVPSDIDLAALDGSPVLSALVWTMRTIGPGGPAAEADVEAALDDAFLAQVSSTEFVGLASQLQAGWRVTGLEDAAPTEVQVDLTSDGETMHLWISVDGDDPPRITGMLFQPPMEDPIDFVGWDEVLAAMTSMVDEVRYLVARVDDEVCTPIAELDADEPGPLGSVFKLYVLGAVVDAVAAGDLSWDDELEITRDLLSHPSGVLQAEEPGTLVPVAEATELMIAVSDNTATDLLIDAVGRDAVEAALSAYGQTDPARNQPLLTTREMVQFAASEDHTSRWVEADEDGRRELLDELAAAPLPPLAALAFDPHVPHEPEWYASPAELCDALVALDAATAGDAMAPGREAFGAEPPPRIDDTWEPIGAKGGSQPGVQAHTALYERGGQRYAFAITLDHSAEIDPRQLVPALEGMIALAADHHDNSP